MLLVLAVKNSDLDARPSDPPDDPVPDKGLVFGCLLDGTGHAEMVDWKGVDDWVADRRGRVLWLHLDRTDPHVRDWLRREVTDVSETVDLLVSNETRPRAFHENDLLVATLRGINLNPGAEPQDMIAMQICGCARFIITLRRRRMQTPRDVLERLQKGDGPQTAGDLFAALVDQLVAKINLAIVGMNDRIDELEDIVDRGTTDRVAGEISDIRRNCLALKRYMTPQREALEQVLTEAPDWLTAKNRRLLNECVDRLRRYMDDIDVSKESALVLQDDLANRADARMNRTMYMLSIVAAVFLPLSFVTGLLGINVGGMPGVDSTQAFWFTVAGLVVLMGFEFVIFWKLKWI